MIERGDHRVFNEPFSRHYYYGPEKVSHRYRHDVLPDSRPGEIVAALERAAGAAPVFVKDMAYHVDGLAAHDLVPRFVNTFIIRDPGLALPSLARMWPDFTDAECGYEALCRLVAAADAAGQDPPIVDSDDLCRDPEGIVRAYCARAGIAFDARALTWGAGMRPEWDLWEDWYEATAATTGFRPPDAAPLPSLDTPHLARAYDRCLPMYRELHARRLEPVW
jgi:hypothetical protein